MILLDTHVWIWWLLGASALPSRERQALDRLAERSRLAIAAVSLWEAQMLHSKGRLTLDRPFATWIEEAADVVTVLPLDVTIVAALAELPARVHGDPADRMIMATARAHQVPVATHDRAIRQSRMVRVWRPGMRASKRAPR